MYKINIETKDADNHRIVVVSAKNGKLILAGEWQARKWKAVRTRDSIIYAIGRGDIECNEVDVPPAYPKNSGAPKTKARKK